MPSTRTRILGGALVVLVALSAVAGPASAALGGVPANAATVADGDDVFTYSHGVDANEVVEVRTDDGTLVAQVVANSSGVVTVDLDPLDAGTYALVDSNGTELTTFSVVRDSDDGDSSDGDDSDDSDGTDGDSDGTDGDSDGTDDENTAGDGETFTYAEDVDPNQVLEVRTTDDTLVAQVVANDSGVVTVDRGPLAPGSYRLVDLDGDGLTTFTVEGDSDDGSDGDDSADATPPESDTGTTLLEFIRLFVDVGFDDG